MKPFFNTYPNPVKDAPFSHYEIQTAREWKSPDGESRFFEVVTDQKDCEDSPLACGPVVFSIYGRLQSGTVEHLCDRKSLNDAIETLVNIANAKLIVASVNGLAASGRNVQYYETVLDAYEQAKGARQ